MQTNFNVDWAVFTVMDANTGAIVASATNPNFNPNDTNTITSYMNPLVSYQYEPGSVMKIFSFASAIEDGIYEGDKTFQSGSYTLQDKTVIRDADRKGWGTISFDTGFAYSSNVAATILGLNLGVEKLTDYYNNLGFGSKTGIELANEVGGKINFIRESELSNASFGQGISVTPIQILQALSSMTNNGTTIKPYIVDKIVDQDGNITYEGKRQIVNKVYSETTTKKMQELMQKVIYEGLSKVWITENVRIMGKTGTAQIASPNGGYLNGEYDYIKSFAGIFPVDNPKYIVYVAGKKPETNLTNWAKVITTAIEEIASYAKLTDNLTNDNNDKLISLNNYISKLSADAYTELESKKLKPILIGDGKYVINQYPLKESIVVSGSKVFIVSNSDNIVMPNIIEWSLNDVRTFASLTGLNLEVNGYGYVTSQSIEANTLLDTQMTLSINLEKK